MAEPVGDLVVDLSLDAARFDAQMARVRRHSVSYTHLDVYKRQGRCGYHADLLRGAQGGWQSV